MPEERLRIFSVERIIRLYGALLSSSRFFDFSFFPAAMDRRPEFFSSEVIGQKIQIHFFPFSTLWTRQQDDKQKADSVAFGQCCGY